jgi:transposase-like protein
MNQASKRRTQYSPEKRAAWVREYRSNGETQQAFARLHGIKEITFRNGFTRASPDGRNRRLRQVSKRSGSHH